MTAYCIYCSNPIQESRIMRGLQSNTPTRYCGNDCSTAAKRERANQTRRDRARISESAVRTAFFEGRTAPEITVKQIRALGKRHRKSLAAIAAEAGLPSNQPIYAFTSGKQASLAPMTRMRLHLYFTMLEEERIRANDIRATATPRYARGL